MYYKKKSIEVLQRRGPTQYIFFFLYKPKRGERVKGEAKEMLHDHLKGILNFTRVKT